MPTIASSGSARRRLGPESLPGRCAQAKIDQATVGLQADLNAAGQKASADLAAAKQQVQTSVQQVIGQAHAALDKANSDYARCWR